MRLALTKLDTVRFADYPQFQPDFAPKTMLGLGVFGGCYFRNQPGLIEEFPREWFEGAVMSPTWRDSVNFFRVGSGQTYEAWMTKGWITDEDPLGWFQWYCRFFLGRRLTNGVDGWQIGRWSSFRARHGGAILSLANGPDSRLRQRQGMLHWAADPQADLRG